MKLIKLFLLLLFFLPYKYSFSKDIKFSGLQKLNIKDLNTLVSINLSKKITL